VIRDRTEAEDQEIEIERVVVMIEAMGNNYLPLLNVDLTDLTGKEVNAAASCGQDSLSS
jgi:hypothetical protein